VQREDHDAAEPAEHEDADHDDEEQVKDGWSALAA
jgi:hypothetical protein